MKPYLTALFISTALSVFVCSCSKNNDVSPTLAETPKYSTTLLRIYEIDTTKQVPNDTISRWVLTYDNANRLTVNSFTSTAVYRNETFLKVRTFEYKGADTTAFRLISKSSNTTFPVIEIDTSYYTFANGICIGDSVIYDYGANFPKGSSKSNFIYQPGLIVRNFQNWIPQLSYTSTERQNIHQTVSNGNVIYQNDTITSTANGQNSGSQSFETSVSYLPNPNPFFKVFNPAGKRYFTGIGIGHLTNSQYAPERLISQQTSSVGSITYAYTFRADGYPLIARMTQNSNGTVSVTKLLFVYAQN